MLEFETQTFSKVEIESIEKLYDHLNLRLPYSLNYEDLHNLYYSLFCGLDILPEKLKSLKLTKEVLARTFVKLSAEKNINITSNRYSSEFETSNGILNENYWIEQITICMRAGKLANQENAKILLGTE